ncbi:kinase-like protein [Thelephora ganbajun]|uniref:Kinase-like protein n=1 Tax=Thelephora ganbajun TaxID=370292 RepID=A0ACB6Z6A6_THEGA|nr:kinase-like protein [Thelephora ganbajun]
MVNVLRPRPLFCPRAAWIKGGVGYLYHLMNNRQSVSPCQNASSLMSSLGLLEQLRRLNRSSSKFQDQVSNILYGQEYKQWAQGVQSDDLVGLVDYLDKALDALDPAGHGFRKCLRELRHICGARTILPTSYALSSSLLIISGQPVASGSSGDLYEGTLNGSKVCVKRVRVYSRDDPTKHTKTFYQEAVLWKRLEHKNIVPLLGITSTPLQLISGWMPGGDLTGYIKRYPDADRLSLLSDVAEGLQFLHSHNIVHGSLKGSNILVDATSHARITDFGLAAVTQNLDSMRSTSDDWGHITRWTPPEILSEEGSYSKEADVFSFAMVMIEVFTGVVPFNGGPPEAAVVAITSGKRPSRPNHPSFTDELWALIQHCWQQDPHLRLEISEVIKVLCGLEPPPIKPSTHEPASSTPTIGQRRLLVGYQQATSHPPSSHNMVSSSSSPTPQIFSQRPNYGIDLVSPESRGKSVGVGKSQETRSHNSSQAMMQDLPSDADYYRPGEQQGGQLSAHITRRPSRRDTAQPEPPPLASFNPPHFDLSEPQKDQSRDRVYGNEGGAGKSRTDSPATLGGRNVSRRNVSGKGSQSDLNRDSDDNNNGKHLSAVRQKNLGHSRSTLNIGDGYYQGGQSHNPSRHDLRIKSKSRNRSCMDLGETLSEDTGKYWSKAQRSDTRASRSVLNVGDTKQMGYHQSGQSHNPSRAFLRVIIFWRLMESRAGTHLPDNFLRHDLAQPNKSKTDLRDVGRIGYRLNPSHTGDGTLSRSISRRDTPGENTGNTNRNARQCHASPALELF